MKTTILKTLSLVLFCSILFSCSKEDDGIYFDETSEVINAKVSNSEIETEILNLVNEHRKGLGLSTLSPLSTIKNVASGHTDYMIEKGQLSHENFDQRAQTLMNNTNAKSVGENVAYGFNTAEGAVTGWLNSEGHRKIIEGPDYTHFGISADSNNDDRNYFTHIFIKI